MTNKQKEVLRKIIYAVETGGQIYGQQDYSDFTEAYTNSSIEHAITIGAGQWYGKEAQNLLKRIYDASPSAWNNLDNVGLLEDVQTADWSCYAITSRSQKAKSIVAVISTQVGIQCQDTMLDEQIEVYVKEAENLGVTDSAGQAMCANFRHQGGYGAVTRILNKTQKPYTLDTLYAACQTDTGNQVGAYKSRQKMVYESLKKYFPKEETKVSQLQKFIDLGNYYADAVNGQKHPYLEKKSNAYLDDFTKNAGYNNYTLFARDVNSWGQPGCQAQPWCAEYQFWKLVKTLGITKALQIMGGGFYNCVSITNHAKSNGTWHSTPKTGALVIFRNGAHVGSVNDFDDAYIYTNEGNTSSVPGVEANGGSARNKQYRRNDSCIDGYVWIDWGTEVILEEWKATGTATATVNNLYVREAPNGYILGELMKTNRFEIDGKISGAWTHVKVNGIGVGWVATKYIKVDGQTENPVEVIYNKQDKTQRLFVGRVVADVLNVRTWAGTEYPTIKKYPQLAKDNLIDVMNYTQTASNRSKWYYVRIADKYYGFVHSKYIKKA